MDDPQDLLTSATTAAKIGGEVLMGYLKRGVQIRDKSTEGGKTYDLVSDADVESEAAIAKHLKHLYPDHEFLGEESLSEGRVDAESLWIIDPLDGTNNFAHGIPHFAVSIAYYHGGEPVVGVVWNPARGDLFATIRGGGAWHNGRDARVSDARRLDQVIVGCGFYYDRGEMMRCTLRAVEHFFAEHVHGIRRFGTAALDLCFVGCGQFGGFFEYRLSPWDFAAGRLFVEEAGGRVTTASGEPLRLEQTTLVASNAVLHEAIVAITSEHQPSPARG